jgi:hypothetical protein
MINFTTMKGEGGKDTIAGISRKPKAYGGDLGIYY